MKRIFSFALAIAATAALITSCNKVGYKKTASGVLYKIISNSKDSAVKPDQWIKFYFVQSLNDSVLKSNYGRMPAYAKISAQTQSDYSPVEIFNMFRKGDSAVAVLLIDSLIAKKLLPEPLPPFMKKGDKLNFGFRIIDVIANDSLSMADQQKEYEKDAPLREKEEKEQASEMQEEMKKARDAREQELEKSGEAAKGIKAMQDYLTAKGITAQQVGKGSFVQIQTPGTGAQAGDGKYVTINYDGKLLSNDSTFDANKLSRQLGMGALIPGLEEGLAAFREGGKGVVFIPGFRAYGDAPPPGSPFKPFEPMKFEVEILRVADTPDSTMAGPPQMPGRR